jgi:outer membrane receptor protein involved in Fe transport
MRRQIVFSLLILSHLAIANTTIEDVTGGIKGKVIDRSAREPLSYATVAIYSADSVLVDGGITDASGDFSFEVDPGRYYVEVQFIAYGKEVVQDVRVVDRRTKIDLGSIELSASNTSLSEVVVTGERSEMVIGVDRKIFNVGSDLGNTGNSAAEILDNIPTVAVDAEGNISLRGSGGVRMLIDGKPSGLVNAGNAEALRALQGNMIERVEVITNPSARYEAEGMVGIINIVLKKDQRKGVNGSFETTVGYPQRYSLGANVNFRREKVNYFINYGVRYSERDGDGKADQFFPLADPPFRTTIDNERLGTGWSQNIRGGLDFFLNENTTLTAAAMLRFDDENNESRILYRDYEVDQSSPYRSSERIDDEKEVERNMEFSLNLEQKFSSDDHVLNAFVQYMEDGETEDSELTETVLSGADMDDELFQRVFNEEREENFLFQSDYMHPFGNDARFEAGLRGELRKIRNPYEVEELDNGSWMGLDDFTNHFLYDENVISAYLQGANKFGAIGVQLGLRAEYSDITTFLEQGAVENKRDYLDFFPTLHTTYHFNDYNAWQISYSRRINRPHFWSLNPFYGFSDSRNISTGNPNLKPEYTDAYESGYVYTTEASSFYAGVYFRYTSDVIERISYVDEAGITFSVPRNLAERHAYGAETNLSVDPLKWWNLSANVNVYRMQTEGVFEYNNKVTDLSADTYSWDTRINSRMRWDNGLSFQTTFFYRGKEENTQGVRKPFYMMNASLSKEVLKGNGTLTFNVRDVLDSRKFRYELNQPDLISVNERRWSGQQFRLTFVYRLNQNGRRSANGGGEEDNGMGDGGF